jgi:hypothetical protein
MEPSPRSLVVDLGDSPKVAAGSLLSGADAPKAAAGEDVDRSG